MNLFNSITECVRVLVITFKIKHGFICMSAFLKPNKTIPQRFSRAWVFCDLAATNRSVIWEISIKFLLTHFKIQSFNYNIALLLLIGVVWLGLIFHRLLNGHQNIRLIQIHRIEFLKPLVKRQESQLEPLESEILELLLRLFQVSLALELDCGWPEWLRILIIFRVFFYLYRSPFISVWLEESSERLICEDWILWDIVDLCHDLLEVLGLCWWYCSHWWL
jgi:hypothetical protein